MKCIAHKEEAVAVCAYCGRALCLDCIQSPDAGRMVCSTDCADALARGEKAMRQVLQLGRQNASASAFYCYLCGGLSAAAAIAAWFMLPSPFLILFTGGCAMALTASGMWYSRIACKQSGSELRARPLASSGSEEPSGAKVGRSPGVHPTTTSPTGADR